MVGIIGGSNVLSVFAIHDILVHIMQFLPDFSSLSAMVPVSRQIHDIFKHHPIYVVRSVAYNQIGPALPQALRVVRHCQNDDHGRDPSKWPSEEEVLNTLITPQEAHILARNARIVLELEGLYYEMTYEFILTSEKPYPMLRSTLSDISRVRFHRAMYRFWLYALAFHPDESAVPGTGIDNWLEYKELFFNQISNDSELHELFEIYWMLSEQACLPDGHRNLKAGLLEVKVKVEYPKREPDEPESASEQGDGYNSDSVIIAPSGLKRHLDLDERDDVPKIRIPPPLKRLRGAVSDLGRSLSHGISRVALEVTTYKCLSTSQRRLYFVAVHQDAHVDLDCSPIIRSELKDIYKMSWNGKEYGASSYHSLECDGGLVADLQAKNQKLLKMDFKKLTLCHEIVQRFSTLCSIKHKDVGNIQVMDATLISANTGPKAGDYWLARQWISEGTKLEVSPLQDVTPTISEPTVHEVCSALLHYSLIDLDMKAAFSTIQAFYHSITLNVFDGTASRSHITIYDVNYQSEDQVWDSHDRSRQGIHQLMMEHRCTKLCQDLGFLPMHCDLNRKCGLPQASDTDVFEGVEYRCFHVKMGEGAFVEEVPGATEDLGSEDVPHEPALIPAVVFPPDGEVTCGNLKIFPHKLSEIGPFTIYPAVGEWTHPGHSEGVFKYALLESHLTEDDEPSKDNTVHRMLVRHTAVEDLMFRFRKRAAIAGVDIEGFDVARYNVLEADQVSAQGLSWLCYEWEDEYDWNSLPVVSGMGDSKSALEEALHAFCHFSYEKDSDGSESFSRSDLAPTRMHPACIVYCHTYTSNGGSHYHDRGQRGVDEFKRLHQCNVICKDLGLGPLTA
ncbi:hypothetical protein GLOTRDRAFT_96271 [Gloeophyllum trabeum ATCC 11539]|uniref:Alpha-type protein kinase domain-containing protein n=1 Tax=Gloeophyllum trabeum (strain ATCC 11539 / FP-39264 / Madison 617) TaxID=670483 RepID=S7RG81_GLOTA|nr:uncharacterized protein GLOTRDRAFT_96271 [Gloeophyllum trabeum ATCC 11539]EPQ51519.1 hypothetical protein GLOTRDRAFT_96271 [Gloeophyllum trabeum ATCC 11539]